MDNLEDRFVVDVMGALSECHALGYYPTAFEQMVERQSALAAAKTLIRSGAIEGGLKRLRTLGRLDLSVEAAALKPEFVPLFSEEEREAARWKLAQMGCRASAD